MDRQTQTTLDIQSLLVGTIKALCVSLSAHMWEETVTLTPDQVKRLDKIEGELRQVCDEVTGTFNK